VVLVYQKYEIKKLLQFRMISKNLVTYAEIYDSVNLPLWKMKCTRRGKFTPG